jgi:hypothetical protein
MTDTKHQALEAQGFHLYREHFRWGHGAAYRTADSQHFRFVDRGDVLTPKQMLARLKDEWRPQARDDVDYFCFRMEADFTSIPE